MLLLSGDVELNPGPDSANDDTGKQYKELLSLLKGLHTKVDTKHEEIMTSLNEVKDAQTALEQRIAEIDNRLSIVESTIQPSEGKIHESLVPQVTNLNHRLDDIEDRSRRKNNLSRYPWQSFRNMGAIWAENMRSP